MVEAREDPCAIFFYLNERHQFILYSVRMKGEIDKNSFVRLSLSVSRSVQCPTCNAISSTFRTVNFPSPQRPAGHSFTHSLTMFLESSDRLLKPFPQVRPTLLILVNSISMRAEETTTTMMKIEGGGERSGKKYREERRSSLN